VKIDNLTKKHRFLGKFIFFTQVLTYVQMSIVVYLLRFQDTVQIKLR
jgi:hypothetical protein